MCKLCCKEYNTQYRKDNIEKMKKIQQKSYKKNKETAKKYRNKYKEENFEKLKETWRKCREKNKEKNKTISKEYRRNNRKKLNEYAVNRRKTNPIHKLTHNVRGRIRHFLKSKSIIKTNKTFNMIGCTPDELKEYIEKQFIEGMSWENYGYYGWHVDHKIPLDFGKTEEEIYKLCHYTNLQPLWGNDNLKKTNKLC